MGSSFSRPAPLVGTVAHYDRRAAAKESNPRSARIQAEATTRDVTGFPTIGDGRAQGYHVSSSWTIMPRIVVYRDRFVLASSAVLSPASEPSAAPSDSMSSQSSIATR